MALHAHSSHKMMNETPAVDAPTNATASGVAPSGTAPTPKAPSAPSAPVYNTTNTLGALATQDTIVDKEPYDVSRCDQVIMLNAKRIANFDDFSSRAPAFFTISAYMINMFESKDNNKLLESIALSHIKQLPVQLKGSKNCMIFKDSVNHRNITMCIDAPIVFEEIEKAYSDLMTCRVGGDLKKFDPATINSILTASCNGYDKTEGVQFDLPAIRSQVHDELSKAGFIVSDTTVSGSAGFGLNNSTSHSVDSAVTRRARRIDYRVPGTIIKNKRN
jgi:hypothetical protein